MNDQPAVLILAGSAQLRSSLSVLIASSPKVKVIRAEEDLQAFSDLRMEFRPALVILAYDNGLAIPVEQIRAHWPETPLIVLVDQELEPPIIPSAESQAVLVKGILASRLLNVVESLLGD